jgi:benzil reductase ((S)-benzoin forming)
MDCLAVVTGTKSGVGDAVATTLIERGWRVIGIGRRQATIDHAAYEHVRLDLANTASLVSALEPRLTAWLQQDPWTRLGLVNNAALPGLLGPIESLEIDELPSVLAVNVVAPVWLMGAFVRHARRAARVRIVNVSSGAAVRGFAGLGAYGMSKAALRMAGMVLAAELETTADEGRTGDLSILSYEPGTVDTPMQANARRATRDQLPSIDLFNRVFDSGLLVPPSEPARAIADYLASDGHPRFDERRYPG